MQENPGGTRSRATVGEEIGNLWMCGCRRGLGHADPLERQGQPGRPEPRRATCSCRSRSSRTRLRARRSGHSCGIGGALRRRRARCDGRRADAGSRPAQGPAGPAASKLRLRGRAAVGRPAAGQPDRDGPRDRARVLSPRRRSSREFGRLSPRGVPAAAAERPRGVSSVTAVGHSGLARSPRRSCGTGDGFKFI